MGRLSKQNRDVKGKKGYKFIDDYTGFEEHSSDAVKDYRGFMTTAKHIDHKHPQEYTAPSSAQRALPWSRPEQELTFVDSTTYDEDTGY